MRERDQNEPGESATGVWVSDVGRTSPPRSAHETILGWSSPRAGGAPLGLVGGEDAALRETLVDLTVSPVRDPQVRALIASLVKYERPPCERPLPQLPTPRPLVVVSTPDDIGAPASSRPFAAQMEIHAPLLFALPCHATLPPLDDDVGLFSRCAPLDEPLAPLAPRRVRWARVVAWSAAALATIAAVTVAGVGAARYRRRPAATVVAALAPTVRAPVALRLAPRPAPRPVARPEISTKPDVVAKPETTAAPPPGADRTQPAAEDPDPTLAWRHAGPARAARRAAQRGGPLRVRYDRKRNVVEVWLPYQSSASLAGRVPRAKRAQERR